MIEEPGIVLIARGKRYEREVLVSADDYEWALSQGNWFVTSDNVPITNDCVNTGYACRSIRREGRACLLWLHKAVLLRAEGPPPTPRHIIGDHRNGHRLDCRRSNLRWATHQMNARNLHGFISKQYELSL
jgi:hypothetical protein